MPNINFQDYLNRITQARQEYGQRVAQAPQVAEDLRKQLYGGDEILPQLRGQRTGKVQELWEHDKRLAERYANPESEVYLEDPYAREQARAGQAQATVGEIGDLESMISGREDVLGDMLERGLRVFEAGTKAKQVELQGLMNEMNMAMKLQDRLDKEREKKEGSAQNLDPELLKYIMADVDITDPREIQETIQATGQRYPDQVDAVTELFEKLSGATPLQKTQAQDVYPRNEATMRANIAGLPVTPERDAVIAEMLRAERDPLDFDPYSVFDQETQMPDSSDAPSPTMTPSAAPQQQDQGGGLFGMLGNLPIVSNYVSPVPGQSTSFAPPQQPSSVPSESPAVPAQSGGYEQSVQQEAQKALQGQQSLQDAISNVTQQFPSVPMDQVVQDINTIWVRGG